SGRFYTITGNTSTGLRRANILNPDFYLKDDRQWIDPAAFAPASNFFRGNSGVGIVEGPGLMTWDFSVRKRFRFGEKRDLRLQADVFNAFNRANFSNMETNVSAAGFGILNASGPGRSIQFGVKFGF
ncbi:MAG TPA: hypothetical protein VF599_10105, partial [Pyrinomonadaceae bacterium]